MFYDNRVYFSTQKEMIDMALTVRGRIVNPYRSARSSGEPDPVYDRCFCGHVHVASFIENIASNVYTVLRIFEPGVVCNGPCGLHAYAQEHAQAS